MVETLFVMSLVNGKSLQIGLMDPEDCKREHWQPPPHSLYTNTIQSKSLLFLVIGRLQNQCGDAFKKIRVILFFANQ